MRNQNCKGHICIEGKLYCSSEDCSKAVSDVTNSVILFSYGNIVPFCSAECMEKTLRSYLVSKDERHRANKTIGRRNLLKEMKFHEVGE